MKNTQNSVYQHLGSTPKSWLTSKCLLTPGGNIPYHIFTLLSRAVDSWVAGKAGSMTAYSCQTHFMFNQMQHCSRASILNMGIIDFNKASCQGVVQLGDLKGDSPR